MADPYPLTTDHQEQTGLKARLRYPIRVKQAGELESELVPENTSAATSLTQSEAITAMAPGQASLAAEHESMRRTHMLASDEFQGSCRSESGRPDESDLVWWAIQYILDELPAAKRDAFEKLLDQSQEARESLVEASLLVDMVRATAPQQNGLQPRWIVNDVSILQTPAPSTLTAPAATTQPLPGKSESDWDGTSGWGGEQSSVFASSILCHDQELSLRMTNEDASGCSAACDVVGGTNELLRAKTSAGGQEPTRRLWMSSRIWLSGCLLVMGVGCVVLWSTWQQTGANQLADRDLAATVRAAKQASRTRSNGLIKPSNISHDSDLIFHWVETQQSLLSVDVAADSLAGLDSDDDWADAQNSSLDEMGDVFEAPAWMLAGVQHRTRSEEKATP